ncbi:MAG: low molecular weight phosphatase family protein [Pseudomonadota bacterium]
MVRLPGSVLFCCDHNAVRSPMAEGILKKLHGQRIYVQSAGVKHDMEIDGFTIAVCAEIGVELRKHRARSFLEMEAWGDQIQAFEKIIAMSPAAQRAALEYTRWFSIDVEYWPTLDPTGLGESREQKLESYRQTRDQILERMKGAFPAF